VFSVSPRNAQSALTALKFLLPFDVEKEILANNFISQVEEISLREDKRLKNICTLLLQQFRDGTSS